MTGPNYPPEHNPSSAPGGQLTIGVPFDYWVTVISQYANSPILTQLIANLAAYLDQTANFNAFYNLIWNVDTAQGIGLDIWGRIVGVERVLNVEAGGYFGFEEAYQANVIGVESFNDALLSFDGDFGFATALPGSEPLSQGPFQSLAPASAADATTNTGYAPFYEGAIATSNFRLSDDVYRTLIFAKAAANITNGSIPAINQILINLFAGRGNCYVTEVMPAPYFGFCEASITRPTYIRSFNTLEEYDGAYLGFAESQQGGGSSFNVDFDQDFPEPTVENDSFNQDPLYSGVGLGASAQSSALCAPFNIGLNNPYMAMSYTFSFPLTAVEIAIVTQSGVLPKPVGVAATLNLGPSASAIGSFMIGVSPIGAPIG